MSAIGKSATPRNSLSGVGPVPLGVDQSVVELPASPSRPGFQAGPSAPTGGATQTLSPFAADTGFGTAAPQLVSAPPVHVPVHVHNPLLNADFASIGQFLSPPELHAVGQVTKPTRVFLREDKELLNRHDDWVQAEKTFSRLRLQHVRRVAATKCDLDKDRAIDLCFSWPFGLVTFVTLGLPALITWKVFDRRCVRSQALLNQCMDPADDARGRAALLSAIRTSTSSVLKNSARKLKRLEEFSQDLTSSPESATYPSLFEAQWLGNTVFSKKPGTAAELEVLKSALRDTSDAFASELPGICMNIAPSELVYQSGPGAEVKLQQMEHLVAVEAIQQEARFHELAARQLALDRRILQIQRLHGPGGSDWATLAFLCTGSLSLGVFNVHQHSLRGKRDQLALEIRAMEPARRQACGLVRHMRHVSAEVALATHSNSALVAEPLRKLRELENLVSRLGPDQITLSHEEELRLGVRSLDQGLVERLRSEDRDEFQGALLELRAGLGAQIKQIVHENWDQFSQLREG